MQATTPASAMSTQETAEALGCPICGSTDSERSAPGCGHCADLVQGAKDRFIAEREERIKAAVFLGTIADNTADMDRKGRRRNAPQKGEAHGMAKLTDSQVRAIRSDTRAQRLIAADFGIRTKYVSRIKCGGAWAHLDQEQP